MKIEVFCNWGQVDDVGINITRTPQEVAAYPGGVLIPVDLTSAGARELAAELIRNADLADQLQRDYEEYLKQEYLHTQEQEKENANSEDQD